MSVQITYFVHSTTTDNEVGIATGWLPGELSPLGLKQANQLIELTRDMNFDAVYTSDLKRAVDTATIAFGARFEVRPDARLRECNYGDFNGHPKKEFKTHQESFVDMPYPHGECYEDVMRRVHDFLREIKSNHENGRIAIVSHEAPHLALDVLLKGKTWKQAFAGYWGKTTGWQPGWEYILP